MPRHSIFAMLSVAALSACDPKPTLRDATAPVPISQLMISIGFVPNSLPTNNPIIGTVYNVTRNNSNQITSLVMLCNPTLIDNTLVKEGVNYVVRDTAETQQVASQSLSNNVTVDATSLQSINASLSSSGKTVKQVYIHMNGAKLIDTDETNLDAIANGMGTKNPRCKRIMSNAGKRAEGLMRAFVATVVYSVDTESGQDFGADATFQSVLKANLNAQWDSQSHTFSSGNQLTYGYFTYPVTVDP
jgi:hypothetical protein